MFATQTNASNAILDYLPKQAFALLEPHLEPVDLPLRMQLERPNLPIRYAYFPLSGFASVVSNGTRASIEIGLVGREGVTALAVVLGAKQSPNETYIQSPGEGLRIEAGIFREQMKQSADLRDCLLLYCHVYLIQMSQTCLSNVRGKLEERLSRWLLMAHDRTVGDRLQVTHELLAIMLGVQRPGVTVSVNALERRGVIALSRGSIEVIDRQALEDVSNGSYGLPEAEFARVLGK